MNHYYPLTHDQIPAWADANHVTPDDARQRFIHLAVLLSLSNDPILSQTLVVRGAGALRLFYGNPRPTPDLDFVGLDLCPPATSEAYALSVNNRIRTALSVGLPLHYPNYAAEEAQLRQFIKVQVHHNRGHCECKLFQLRPTEFAYLKVFCLEELLAEKFVALLHPPRSDNSWQQDVHDIAYCLRGSAGSIDHAKLTVYFHYKVRFRTQLDPSKAGFISTFDQRKSISIRTDLCTRECFDQYREDVLGYITSKLL